MKIIRQYGRVRKGKVHSIRTSRSLSKLSRLWETLSWIFLWSLLPLELVAEGYSLILFLLIARFDSLVGYENIADFSRDMEHFGIYDLPCGGGIITNPSGATRWLRRGYGQRGAEYRCILLLSKGPLTSEKEKIIFGLAQCSLYKLGDSITIERLQKLRIELLQALSSSGTTAQSRSDMLTRLKDVEALIAGLCQRLGMVIPDDIPPLDEDGIRYWFH